MLSDKTWKELMKQWAVIGKIYQEPRRVKERLQYFCDNVLQYLEGMRVLEIGCNAGVYGYCISQVADFYIGVEPGNLIAKKPYKTDYFAQALMTSHFMKNSHFCNNTIKGYIKDFDPDINAFFASYALYHFTDKELEILKTKVWNKCDRVIIQTRSQERPTPHNSYKFWKWHKVEKFFSEQGFKCETIWDKQKRWSIQICRK